MPYRGNGINARSKMPRAQVYREKKKKKKKKKELLGKLAAEQSWDSRFSHINARAGGGRIAEQGHLSR